jgi:hypothetical protein
MFFCINCRMVHLHNTNEDKLFKTAFHYHNGEKIAVGFCVRVDPMFGFTETSSINIKKLVI